MNQQTFPFVAIDTVLGDIYLDVVSSVSVTLDLNATVVIVSKVVLLNVNDPTDMFIDRVREPADVDT